MNATTINQLAEEIESLRSDLEFVNDQVVSVDLYNQELTRQLAAVTKERDNLLSAMKFLKSGGP